MLTFLDQKSLLQINTEKRVDSSKVVLEKAKNCAQEQLCVTNRLFYNPKRAGLLQDP